MDKKSRFLWRVPWVVVLCIALALIGPGLAGMGLIVRSHTIGVH